jgi:hypothetical protein
MSSHFVVEAEHTTAGLAVRVPGGYRFFYSDPHFRSLDGKVFRRARALAGAVRAFARRNARVGSGAPEQPS